MTFEWDSKKMVASSYLLDKTVATIQKELSVLLVML